MRGESKSAWIGAVAVIASVILSGIVSFFVSRGEGARQIRDYRRKTLG